MEKPIIEVKNLGKKYDIAHMRGGYVALRDVLAGIARKPFAFLARRLRSAAGMEKKEAFWALKNVNFTVKRGEVIGVIGANGAGKSTLLKILSQITPPTEGEVILRGRVGSLLEVGTGFHPELSGRENIFLNGAILGMKRAEIARKFDEIVAFAGVEKFLDTPVKFYSSGMYVRLAFSVAAHMEPDILIIDEVLAVGDSEFQKKCLGKMDEITKNEGRTIFFVSHNMGAIQTLCQKCILLEHGTVAMIGETQEVINAYVRKAQSAAGFDISGRTDRRGDGSLRVSDIRILDEKGSEANSISAGKDFTIALRYELKDPKVSDITIALGIDNNLSNRIAFLSNSLVGKNISTGSESREVRFRIHDAPLNAGDYYVTVFIDEAGKVLDWVQKAATFSILPGHFYASGNMPQQGDMLLSYGVETK
ncbi:MAG: Teichoic-acid-transporting ATPase [Candidatus Parcubacteria bacterium]|nr:Teichoic-acid-transporting ATPase [Candidatus Parcubacteria bacterium]